MSWTGLIGFSSHRDELFSFSGDWELLKPLQSSSTYNSLKCYFSDKENSFLVNRKIIESCLKQLEVFPIQKRELSDFNIKPEFQKDYPVETHFFLRVLRRKEDEVGKEILLCMVPKFSNQRLQNIWNHTVRVSNSPPMDKEFSQLRQSWNQQKFHVVCSRLRMAFEKDKGLGSASLKNFVFSKHFEDVAKEQEKKNLFGSFANQLFSMFSI